MEGGGVGINNPYSIIILFVDPDDAKFPGFPLRLIDHRWRGKP